MLRAARNESEPLAGRLSSNLPVPALWGQPGGQLGWGALFFAAALFSRVAREMGKAALAKWARVRNGLRRSRELCKGMTRK